MEKAYRCPHCKAVLTPKLKRIFFKVYNVIECDSDNHKYLRKIKYNIMAKKVKEEKPIKEKEPVIVPQSDDTKPPPKFP